MKRSLSPFGYMKLNELLNMLEGYAVSITLAEGRRDAHKRRKRTAEAAEEQAKINEWRKSSESVRQQIEWFVVYGKPEKPEGE